MHRYVLILCLTILLTACGSEAPAMPAPINTQAIFPTLPSSSSSTVLPTVIAFPSHAPMTSLEPTLTATFVIPSLTPSPDDQRFSIGQSVEGREIWAWQFGDGP